MKLSKVSFYNSADTKYFTVHYPFKTETHLIENASSILC